MRVLLITPPLVQLNTPYPATPYLTAFLREKGFDAHQFDASLELALKLFSRRGIERLAQATPRSITHPSVSWFRRHHARYAATVDNVVRFIQGREPGFGAILLQHKVPEGPRFAPFDQVAGLSAAAGRTPVREALRDPQELARYMATLYIEDLTDAITHGIDPRFGLARYAETLSADMTTFDPLKTAIDAPPTIIGTMIGELADAAWRRFKPEVIGFTIPFPGTLYGALAMARRFKKRHPAPAIIMGGGYISTEFRTLTDPRLFDYCDYLVFDDGYEPLRRILAAVRTGSGSRNLIRTMYRADGRIVHRAISSPVTIPHSSVPAPCYDDLSLDKYMSLGAIPNPMHRLWTDGRWNKYMLAHGCYWHRCRFCDTTLDYIHRHDAPDADHIIDQLVNITRATGYNGFHFVDEAASPALLRRLATRLIERNVTITWWTNIRFERSFTPDLANLLARSGCIAVSGGLETACDRTLLMMDKGIDRTTAANAIKALGAAGIMVHAYLMYGFPTQTRREIISALEFVRCLFRQGALSSAFWHRFALSVHSPMYTMPDKFGMQLMQPGAQQTPSPVFARNEAPFHTSFDYDPDQIGRILYKATYNYMHGIGWTWPMRRWFGGGEC